MAFSDSLKRLLELRLAANLLVLILLVQAASAQDVAWESLGPDDETIFAAEILSDGNLLVGGRTNLFLSSSRAGIWSTTSLGNTHPFLTAVAALPDGTVFTGDGFRLYRRNPGDTTWTEAYETITHGRTWLTSLFTARDSNIVALTFGLYKFKDEYSMLYVSHDGGSTWSIQFQQYALYRASIGSDGDIVAGTWMEARDEAWASNNILRSADSGQSWSIVKELGSMMVRDFVSTKTGDLYAGAAASVYGWYPHPRHDESRPGEGALYRSLDQGLTWTNIEIPEEDRAIVSLTACCGSEIYALSAGGTIYSVEDDGKVASVARFDTSGTHPIELLVDEQRRAYVATIHDGIFRSAPLISTAIERDSELPRGIVLDGNYPNPFHQQTKILYELPRAMHIKLTVFDVLGREVDTLVDGLVQAGTHEAVFDAGALPNSVYLYRLGFGGSESTGTMTLLRSGRSAGR